MVKKRLLFLVALACSTLPIGAIAADCVEGGPPTFRTENRSTGKTTTFEGDSALLSVSRVSNVTSAGFNLLIETTTVSKHETYFAPELQRITISERKAQPGFALLGSILTFGIYPLAAPKAAFQQTFGCSDEVPGEFLPDKNLATASGKFVWRDNPTSSCSMKVSVTSKKGYSRFHDVTCERVESKTISLAQDILSGALEPNSELFITCENCNVVQASSSDTGSTPSALTELVVRIDMMRLKENEIERLVQVRAVETERLEKAREAEIEQARVLRQEQIAQEKVRAKEQETKKLAAEREKRMARENLEKEQNRVRKNAVNSQMINL